MQQEAEARAFADELCARGLNASSNGAGAHWYVDVQCTTATRTARVAVVGFGLGPWSGRYAPIQRPNEGVGWLVTLFDGVDRVRGRTLDRRTALRAIELWAAGATLDETRDAAPFVDEAPRLLRSLAEGLDPALAPDVDDALWVRASDRSARVAMTDEGTVACELFLGPEPVASGVDLPDVASALHAWVRDVVPIAEITGYVPGVELRRHAEVLEVDPARWHWLHVQDRIDDPDDVLARLAPFLRMLVKSEVATRFFTFSSMSSLCFSASSHHPWVRPGLPSVSHAPGNACLVDEERFDYATALRVVEERLLACPVAPFFGTGVDQQERTVGALLRALGSPLGLQRGPRNELFLSAGDRQCRLLGTPSMSFDDETYATWVSWASDDASVPAIRRFLEDGAPVDELLRDPAVVHFSPTTLGLDPVTLELARSRVVSLGEET